MSHLIILGCFWLLTQAAFVIAGDNPSASLLTTADTKRPAPGKSLVLESSSLCSVYTHHLFNSADTCPPRLLLIFVSLSLTLHTISNNTLSNLCI